MSNVRRSHGALSLCCRANPAMPALPEVRGKAGRIAFAPNPLAIGTKPLGPGAPVLLADGPNLRLSGWAETSREDVPEACLLRLRPIMTTTRCTRAPGRAPPVASSRRSTAGRRRSSTTSGPTAPSPRRYRTVARFCAKAPCDPLAFREVGWGASTCTSWRTLIGSRSQTDRSTCSPR
jgi:hypothetical protein